MALPAGAAHAGAQGAEPSAPCAATNYRGAQAHAEEEWARGGAGAREIGTHAPEGERMEQKRWKRSAAWAELSKLQDARVSANADWVSARKLGSDGLEGSLGGGAEKRRKPAKRWGISLSVPAETPPVEVGSGLSLGASGVAIRERAAAGAVSSRPHAPLEPARTQTCIAACRRVLRMPLYCSAPSRRRSGISWIARNRLLA